MLLLQVGMFSFWSAVAFVPRVLLDQREHLRRIRTALKRFLIVGMAFIYTLTFAAPENLQFAAGISSILLVFIGSNFLYLRYLQLLAIRSRSLL